MMIRTLGAPNPAREKFLWLKNWIFGVIFALLGPKTGSKVPYLISGIATNGNNYLPCDFEPIP